jgi:hypothetical protein
MGIVIIDPHRELRGTGEGAMERTEYAIAGT